ncbi:hypothetical protein [Stenotrophomonas sp. BIGb0135]|uniref:hypothetical protein n=1 Tax=Stenotrophomonas sp. BIGb0135 TaxID=2940620 RepID=UPI00216A4B21|nr:hypothetical protein [Stenotrophomonas sp. BIGb0135]MCS4233106.1 hypothetical protein [Stenotrophomonas sp. BIGb0135]
MTNWSTRKIEVRDVLVVSVIAALWGAVLSWLIFAWTGEPAKTFDIGSVSDWAAAAGTWVIGYGAWKYAKESHLQRVAEVRSTLRRENNALLNKLKIAKNRAAAAARGRSSIGDFFEREDSERTLLNARARVEVAEKFLTRLHWDDAEKVVLYPGALDVLDKLEVRVAAFLDMAARFRDEYPEITTDPVTDDTLWIAYLIEQANAAGALSDELVGLIEAQHAGVSDAMQENDLPHIDVK